MKNCEYYISYKYKFTDVRKTISILRKLGFSGHKVLYGVNYVGNTGIFESTVAEINNTYAQYVSGSCSFGKSKDISSIPNIISRVITKDMLTDEKFVSDTAVWDYIMTLTTEKAFKYKYLVALLLKIFTAKYSFHASDILTSDKIRFCGEKDISFSTNNGICGELDDRNLYIWFEIDVEKELPLLSNSALELIITDNLEKLDDYIYSLSIVEYNNFNLVIGGNNLDVLMNSEMLDICSEENQFVRYRPELKKYM